MNGIIVIDKPAGWTSHDVVAKLRGVLREKRVGHGGTLDPMATGVLPVFSGRATRAVTFCEDFDKEYIAGLRLGLVTDTQDTTGTTLSQSPAAVTDAQVRAAAGRFIGRQEQIPPMYSAIRVRGQRLYELARRGIETERAPRPITIHELEVLGRSDGDYLLRVVCSKGTYIRTLCHDIGALLGCGGAMSALRRTRVGVFSLDDAVSIADVESFLSSGQPEGAIRPVDSLFAQHPEIRIAGSDLARCLNGGDFPIGVADGLYRVCDSGGVFLMLGCARDGRMYTVKSFFDVGLPGRRTP